ncbi:MAG: sulfatase [Akkermansiaceae bacterium]|nr:sulfatase [Akkermansiaceae bacterium]
MWLRISGGRYLLTVFHASDLTTGSPKYQFRFTSSLGPFRIAMIAVISDPRLMLRLLLPILVSTALASEKPNIIVILADDHRYDFLSCHPEAPDFLETPNLDRMAKEGAHLKNAFVTTSLCSPSRASILTGQYMHHHRVVDNQRSVPEGTRFYPEYLQTSGYRTAMIGKWHMGHDNDGPRKGFHHWVSFQGQGSYFNQTLNINGKRHEQKGYTADRLTDQAIAWLKSDRGDQKAPFMMHLAFKSVHYPFQPAKRHHGKYQGKKIDYPETMANSEENYATQSRWIRERRYGIHGIDHMETGAFDKDPVPSFDDLYWRFCETVHGLDENVGRILKHLDESGLSKNTIVLYLGDNGFHLGEHGFYDKRDAFEHSIRVPLLAYAPGKIKAGTDVNEMILNIDLAPTLLEFAGIKKAENTPGFDGRSFKHLLDGNESEKPWRDHLLYEYHWEWNFPATPTLFAIRTNRYKFIYYHGLWDKNGLYDLQTDPQERHNLIDVPAFAEKKETLREQLFSELQASGALEIPIRPPKGDPLHDRKLRR